MRLIITMGLALLAVACQPVGMADMANLNRPAMVTQPTGPRQYSNLVTMQLETGRANTLQAAGGCASCQ